MKLTRLSRRISLALLLGGTASLAIAQEDAPPTAPTGLFANAYSGTAAGVAWSPSEDDAGVRAYEVTLDGAVVQESDARSYIDIALTPATTYRVGVTAIDTAGQRSETAFVEFDTVGGTSASGPAPVEGLRASVYSSTALGLAWTRPATPGLIYEVSRDGEVLGTTDGVSYIDIGLTAGDYVYEVVAVDRQGARSDAASLDVSTFAGMTSGDDITPDDDASPDDGEPMPVEPAPEDTSTPVGNSILDLARGTDEDGDGVFDGAAEGLATLVESVGAYPELVNLLDDESARLTLFAPTDDAFAAVDLAGLDAADIENVLSYHVVSGSSLGAEALDAAALEDLGVFPLTLETVQGGTLEIVDLGDGGFAVIDSAGNRTPLEAVVDSASNGVVYLLDSVLAAPPAMDPSGDPSTDGAPTDEEVPVDGTPTDGMPTDEEAPVVEETPVDETPTDGTPVDPEAPVGPEAPIDPGAPVDETPSIDEDAPAEEEATEPATEETSPTPTGSSILDLARGTDEDGDGVFEGAADGLGTLVQALGEFPALLDVLDDESAELTVFAPTDDAFAAVDLAGLGAADVENVLRYHVVSGTVLAVGDAALPITLTTVQGGTLDIVDAGDGRLAVMDAAGNQVALDTVVDSASNGVVYLLDSVLAAPPAAP